MQSSREPRELGRARSWRYAYCSPRLYVPFGYLSITISPSCYTQLAPDASKMGDALWDIVLPEGIAPPSEDASEDESHSDSDIQPPTPPDLERIARDRESIKNDIREALDGVDSKGSFAAFGHLSSFVDPQLSVDPCGPVRMPLLDVDATRIIAASHQAPFGKGERTIVDPTVRRTWELNHDQFNIQNPHFANVVSQAVGYCSQELGIETDNEHTVEAQPYKLLLYEKGALFKPHTESVHYVLVQHLDRG